MSRTVANSKTRSARDFYPTPSYVIEPLLPYIDFTDAVCLEPCRGDGVIYDRLPDPKIWAEISEGCDYLADPYPADICITNPPFSLALEFAENALDECPCVIFLLPLSFLEAKSRIPFWRKWPLTHLFPIVPRPSFTNGSDTDQAAYAWFVWDNEGDRITARHWHVPLCCPKPNGGLSSN